MLASCKRDGYWQDPNAPYFRGRTEQYCVLTFAPVVYSGAAKRVVSPSIRRTHSHAGGPAAFAFRNGSVRSISQPRPQRCGAARVDTVINHVVGESCESFVFKQTMERRLLHSPLAHSPEIYNTLEESNETKVKTNHSTPNSTTCRVYAAALYRDPTSRANNSSVCLTTDSMSVTRSHVPAAQRSVGSFAPRSASTIL